MLSPNNRSILHVDMDSFFVSVERLLNPALEGRPVLVGGDPARRGVVASASYEARRFGVHSAMPMARALRLCPDAVVVKSGFAHYIDFSARVRQIFERFSPLVEMASLDEAYIDLTGTERLWGPAWRAAEALRKAVWEETRLPCSLGLAGCKVVAKVASDLAKPRGFLRVFPGGEAALLAMLPLRALPGIGPKTAERLRSFGLRTIGELAALGVDTLEGLFGAGGRELWERALGRDSSRVEPGREAKSIGREHTFPEDVDDPARVIGVLSHLAEHVAGALRAERLQARTITLKIRYSDFQLKTAACTLLLPADDERILLRVARDLLRRHWDRRVRLRLAGISTSRLAPAAAQFDLFDQENQKRATRLHKAIDAIRERHGFSAIERARSFGAMDDSPPLTRGNPAAQKQQSNLSKQKKN